MTRRMQAAANIQVRDMLKQQVAGRPRRGFPSKGMTRCLVSNDLTNQLNQTVMGSRRPCGTFRFEAHRRKSIYVGSSHRLTTFCGSVFYIIFSGTPGIFCGKKPQNFFGFSPGIKVKKQSENKARNIRRNSAGTALKYQAIFLYSFFMYLCVVKMSEICELNIIEIERLVVERIL